MIQSSVPVNVTNRAAHIQPSPPPFRIINQSLTATVWVAGNPSVQPGFGTPVSGGTSIQWTQPGDIYLILGDDAQSVTAGSAAVIISYDVADWQASPAAIAAAVLNSGILVIDNPTLLGQGSALSGTAVSFDVSRYQSLNVRFDVTAVITSGAIQIAWYTSDGVTLLAVDYVNIAAAPSQFLAQVPCKGTICKVNTTPGNFISALTWQVWGSNRSVPKLMQSQAFPKAYSGGQLLESQTAVLAGGAQTASLRTSEPWFGEVEIIGWISSLNANPLKLTIFIGNNTIIYADCTTKDADVWVGDVWTMIRRRIYLKGMQLQINATNLDGVNRNVGFQVIPAC